MVIDVPVDSPQPRPLTEEEWFCLEGCRSYKQYYHMRRKFEEGVCALCNPDSQLNHILWEDEWFRVWHVDQTLLRKELLFHFLIVPKRHVRFMSDFSISEWASLGSATEFIKECGYTGGLFHAREGDMRKNAGTVPHLHINVFQPNGTGDVRVPVFKNPRDREKNQERAARFRGHYENHMTPEDFTNYVARNLLTENGQMVLPL